MILAGIASACGARVPLVGRGLVSGLWLAFIGWFLSNAATQSYRRVVIEDILDDVSISRMMRENPPTVPSNISLESFVHDYVMRTDDYGFPVVDGEELRGIITLDDVRAVPRQDWATKSVGEVMTPRERLITADPEECASEALDKLTRHDIRQLPVVQEGRLVGLVRRRDIVRWLRLHSELS
ncbi:MAG: CBS domain-containing protein [Clostridia bacterium]|nr:CBS domain-containing protein [Clostridia bacterium]